MDEYEYEEMWELQKEIERLKAENERLTYAVLHMERPEVVDKLRVENSSQRYELAVAADVNKRLTTALAACEERLDSP